MPRYVVSAPRSGLNWLRFCIETFYGRRTPGKTSVLDEKDVPETVIVRSHDALNFTGKSTNARDAWATLVPEDTADDAILLILRDPLETFVRMAGRDWKQFRAFISNIVFYDQSVSARKAVAYYDDLVSSPDAMLAAMEILDIEPAEGYARPTLAQMVDCWEELGQRSRGNYDVKQAAGGGSQTKDAPTDFTFHQRGLSEAEKRLVWVYLQRHLSASQLALLDRFLPADGRPRANLLDRWRLWRAGAV